MIAGREATATATKNYSVGDLLIVGNVLYRATAAIATGETITEGTNVTADTVADELAALEADKADKVGEAPDLTAGSALQLLSTVGITDQVPYNFRTSGGALDIGDRETDEIVGGTVVWNQQFATMYTKTALGVTYTRLSQSTFRLNGTVTGNTWYYEHTTIPKTIIGHVYLVDKGNTGAFAIYNDNSGVTVGSLGRAVIGKATDAKSFYVRMQVGTVYDNVEATPMIIDLTKMFGTTIADYVYSLEQSTPGAGVAWFRKLFPNDYYDYDPGTLRSVKTSAHRMIGFNAYDATTGTARLLGGNQYQITGAYTALAYSTGETITPDADGKFTPAANGALTVTGGGATTCIHLAYGGERDGEYEPFEAHTYALDPIELRGIPRIDGNGSIYWDGDRYKSDGTVKRRFGIVDLGTLTWKYNTNVGIFYTDPKISDIGTISVQRVYPIVCSKYIAVAAANNNGNIDKSISVGGLFISGGVNIKDTAYSTEADFKAAMSGVYLVYQRATTTTETASPYTNTQNVDNWGTEEYIDADVASGDRDVAIPVGHVTEYPQDLRSKIEAAPNSPDADGDYIVRRMNGENVYAPLLVPEELPAAPSEDGTYRLSVTVTDGTPTLSWVSDT